MNQAITTRVETLTSRLKHHRQEHLLTFFDQLSGDQRLQLLQDLENIDLDLTDRLARQFIHTEPQAQIPNEILPAPYFPASPPPDRQEQYDSAHRLGQDLITANKVAAFTVAGGQGTRLNIDGPKGDVPVTPVRQKTLFCVFAESLLAAQRRYNCTIPWYIMTSPANHEDTIASFEKNDYFGLDSSQVMHFRQGMMPSFDMDGKILLAEPHRVATNPDGHGGSLRALHASGALDDMAQRGIQFISYFQIDNPLVSPIDPLFIGLHAQAHAEMSSKAVIKCKPLEKVGNFVMADDKITVIEYSDLPDKLASKLRGNGGLMFELGSIAIHIISCSFVARLNQRGFSLPWHRAIKKIKNVATDSHPAQLRESDAVKFETFVFDALPLAQESIILEIDRADQFAPVKNATGVDSLQTSQKLQIARASRWMEQAGIEVPRKPDGSPDATIEISPLFALDVQELKQKSSQLHCLKPGDTLYLG